MKNTIEDRIKKAQKETIESYLLEVAKKIASAQLDLKVLKSVDENTVIGERPTTQLKGAMQRITAKEQIGLLEKSLQFNEVVFEVALKELERYK